MKIQYIKKMDPNMCNVYVQLPEGMAKLHQNDKGEIVDNTQKVICPAEIKPKVLSVTAASMTTNLKFYSRILLGTQVRIYWYKYPNSTHGFFHLSTNSEVYTTFPPTITNQVRFGSLEPDLVYYAILLADNKLVLCFITDRKGKAIKNITHIVKSGMDSFSYVRIFNKCNDDKELVWVLDSLIGDMSEYQAGVVLYGETAQEVYDVPNPKHLKLVKHHLQKLA